MNQDEQVQAERERILARYFKVASIKGDNRQLVKRFLLGALWAAVLTPLLFYLKFGTVGWFAIGFTVFLVLLSLLFALGFSFQTRTEYHTRVPTEGTIADRIGAFWLAACVFGPFIGWIVTAFPPTSGSWKWQYLARAFLAVTLPVITAIPNVPYARSKAAWVAIPLLIFITALPISSCLWVLADLHDGPRTVRVQALDMGSDLKRNCQSLDDGVTSVPCEEIRPVLTGEQYQVKWLPHTRRVLAKQKIMR